jgi:hypothetical protein
MTATTDLSLIERRRLLRQQLTVQRQSIARQLDPIPEVRGGYPRSVTMRFLTRRPALMAGLLAGLAGVLVRARFIKSMTTALGMFRVVRSVTGNRIR